MTMTPTSLARPGRRLVLLGAALLVATTGMNTSVATAGTPPASAGETVVTPPEFVDTAASSDNSFPWNCAAAGLRTQRYQQVYQAADFKAGPITSMAFRLARGERGFGPTTLPNVTITMSTTQASPDSLSTGFDANIGSDAKVVHGGDLTLTGTESPDNAPVFGTTVLLAEPFSYDPAVGNLLLDIDVATCVSTAQFEATNDSRAVGRSWTYPGGSRSTPNTGLVTRFTYGSSNTTPTAMVGGVTEGTAYEFGTPLNPTCNGTDVEDGSLAGVPAVSALIGPRASLGLGQITVTCVVTDSAGAASASATATYNVVDTTKPTITFAAGGVQDGASYIRNSVPLAPKCSATDTVSPAVACVVSGYSDQSGNQTLTATATDDAGNTATATRRYTVRTLLLSPFRSPVEDGVLNLAKGGSTVPLKFTLTDGTTPITSTIGIVFKTTAIPCGPAPIDTLEDLAAGASALRYDTAAGQFIQTWKTPATPGCYRASISAPDGTTQAALFKLK